MQTPGPSPTLGCCRVLVYAVLNDSVSYAGSNLYRDGKEVGPVPCLAICRDDKTSEVLLLHCDHDWTVLGVVGSGSLQAAKESAEHIYRGVSKIWGDAHITEEQAASHLAEVWGPQKCNFCGRTPLDFDNPRFFEKNGTFICDACVRACYEMLREDGPRT